MARLSGITVLVTGASSALGLTTIGRLVGEGAEVVAAEFGDDSEITAAFGEHVEVLALDVTSPESWQQAAESFGARGSGLHGLVNSAASVRTGPLTAMPLDDVRTMIDVNMLGPALGIRALAPLLAASGGGSIVNIASTEAMRGSADAAVFSATNWGLRGLTRSAALELGSMGIRVNAVCPSIGLLARQPALADAGSERAVTMGDVAAMVAFLLSDDSATCTGGDFMVDAGASA